MTMRPVAPGDSAALTAVALRCLLATYADLLPPRMIERLPLQARLAVWTQAVCADAGAIAYLAENAGVVAGFAVGRETAGARGLGELEAIYLLPGVQARGLGSQLFAGVCDRFLGHGIRRLSLWALSDNIRACRFYERLGGVAGRIRSFAVEDALLSEVEYRWPDVRVVLDRCA